MIFSVKPVASHWIVRALIALFLVQGAGFLLTQAWASDKDLFRAIINDRGIGEASSLDAEQNTLFSAVDTSEVPSPKGHEDSSGLNAPVKPTRKPASSIETDDSSQLGRQN